MALNINPNEESSRSQCAMILDWLERGFSINWMQAVEKFGCGRLPGDYTHKVYERVQIVPDSGDMFDIFYDD